MRQSRQYRASKRTLSSSTAVTVRRTDNRVRTREQKQKRKVEYVVRVSITNYCWIAGSMCSNSGNCSDSAAAATVVVPVEVIADRVNRAHDVHLRHGGHHDTKLEVAPVTCLESTLLTFGHLVLISCVHEIRIHEAHEQRESGLRNETADTVCNEDPTRVDTGQFSESEVARCSATARLVQARKSSSTVLLPSRLDVDEPQFEMQRLRELTSATER